MLKFTVTKKVEGAKDSQHPLLIATTLPEMEYRQYIKYVDSVLAWPEWMNTLISMHSDKQAEAFANLADIRMAEYWRLMVQVVECFTAPVDSFKELLQLPVTIDPLKGQEELKNNIAYLSHTIITNISNYTPLHTRAGFKHGGYEYILPEDEKVEIGDVSQVTPMANVTTGQVIEALQRAQIISSKDADGVNVVPDHKYHADIAMIACMARRVVDGKPEELPLGEENYSSFIHKRVKELAKLPADIALDVCFFLLNSYIPYIRILSQKLSLRLQDISQQSHRKNLPGLVK